MTFQDTAVPPRGSYDYEARLVELAHHLDVLLLPTLALCSKALFRACAAVLERELWLKCTLPRPPIPVFHPQKLFITGGDYLSIYLEPWTRQLTLWIDGTTVVPKDESGAGHAPFVIHRLEASTTLVRLSVHFGLNNSRLEPSCPVAVLPKSLQILECTGENIGYLFNTTFPKSLRSVRVDCGWEEAWLALTQGEFDPTKTKLYLGKRLRALQYDELPARPPRGGRGTCPDCGKQYIQAFQRVCCSCIHHHPPWYGFKDHEPEAEANNPEVPRYNRDVPSQQTKRKMKKYVTQTKDKRFWWCNTCKWAHTTEPQVRLTERVCGFKCGNSIQSYHKWGGYICPACMCALRRTKGMGEEYDRLIQLLYWPQQ